MDVAKRAVGETAPGQPIVYIRFWCPGCDGNHMIPVERTDGGVTWEWDGSLDAPTISPSLLVNAGHAHPGKPTCHSFIKGGEWQFLTDSTHNLAGQTVPMLPVDQWPY